ncbi:helix-turn-helix domain-containing protein [Streptomyces kronopolitis]
MPDLRPHLGLAVRAARVRCGWSQELLSERSGLDRTYVSGLECGRRNPAFLTLVRLAEALQVPLSDLIRDAEESAGAIYVQH